MAKKNMINTIALLLTIVGAVNWGLVGLLGLDLVTTILGTASTLSKIVYGLIGASGVLLAYKTWFK